MKNHYNNCFESNWKNIKDSWKGLKSIATIKNISTDIPKNLFVSGTSIFNPMAISNLFNDYFP